MNKLKIESLYSEISNCHICPKMDKKKSIRNPDAVSPNTDVFIISQALAEGQLRETGVNFFSKNGNPGDTGKRLEIFLNKLQQTIYPPQGIELNDGVNIPVKSKEFSSVYNTEITQCYPGKSVSKKGDRIPEKPEIINCFNQGFLHAEINLIKPKLLLLMGKTSTNNFYQHFLNIQKKQSLNAIIEENIAKNSIPTTNIFGFTVGFTPIQHASGANPNFNKMLDNLKFIQLINNFLYES
jgi:uracil-DNA glycosylase family 4